jgi:hypothetical protein
MKNKTLYYGLAGLVAAGAIAIGTLGLNGCTNPAIGTQGLSGCSNPENRTYDFATKILNEDPNRFSVIKNREDSIIYYDKNLKVDIGFFGAWPEGKGLFMELYKDGNFSMSDTDTDEAAKFISGKINASKLKGNSFDYTINKNSDKEIITLVSGGSMISYNRVGDNWEKICYDMSKVKESIEASKFPILSKKNVGKEEVARFLELAKDIKEKYYKD